MRLKLFLLLLLTATLPSLAQTATVVGVVTDGSNGSPVSGAYVTLQDRGVSATTGFNGDFRVTGVQPGDVYVIVTCDGYQSAGFNATIKAPSTDLGTISLTPDSADDFYGDNEDMIFDESVLEDEEGNTQGIAALTGANDDIYYSTASYNFSPMYFRYRGYDSEYQTVYINGVPFNDLIRGRFNFSSLLGMTSRAFRNKTTTIGMGAANYGFGSIGGSTNYNTVTDLYAPGFNGSLAFTNSNYMLRAMATYASGVNKHGWAYTVSGIGRYANEGVIEGTFYNSGGLFLSVEKIFNPHHSLTLTAFGGPTQRATAQATYQEAYDLAGSNLYNPAWGWQDGKKRSSRITETFDPTVMLNYIFKKNNTTVNTSAAMRWVRYTRTAIQYYQGNNPDPSYYRNLPSYYKDSPEQFDMYTDLWKHDKSFRQIDWDELYQMNYLNNIQNETLPEADKKGSSYIMENRVSNQVNAIFNSYVNTRINDCMSLQGGVTFNYTKASFYKTIRDLMGGEFWIDVDPFSLREFAIAPDNLQNDLDHPYRRVKEGDKFGYNYDIRALQATAWLQNVITLPHWDVNYGIKMSYTQFQREGYMRNGRAPQNSLGKSDMLKFDNGAIKAGATYKLNGRNYFSAHVEYGTRSPLVDNVFIAPRVKNTVAANVESERDFSGDLGYTWNYRRFRGSLTGFYTQVDNGIERTGFYDDYYRTYTNYVLTGVKRVYKGIELGMAYKITPSITATFAGTYARYQYKNNPQGTRTFENGLHPDTTQTVYLKNFYLGSTPQTQCNLGIDWAAPGNWFFNINGTFQGDAYVNLSPRYHEQFPGLASADIWDGGVPTREQLEAKIEELTDQDKLKNAFTLNLSIGKLIYINRKVSMNINLNINNVLNNRDVVTYAYQQGRLNETTYDRNAYPNRYSYAQGVRAFLNIGVRF
ncbi:MAG: carboxypeptidase regulatory-like domain-containing protein [Muribaculaceae bacterium]